MTGIYKAAEPMPTKGNKKYKKIWNVRRWYIVAVLCHRVSSVGQE